MDLTQINAPIKQKDGSTVSLLTLAVKANKIDIVNTLIKKGAEVNNPNITTFSPLYIADTQKKKEKYNASSKKSKAFLEVVDTALYRQRLKEIQDALTQTTQQYEEIERVLIQSGAKRNIFDVIAFEDETGLIELLLDKKVNLNDKNLEGKTPLYYAIDKDFDTAIELLIKAGADIHSKDYNGLSPIQYADSLRSEGLVKILLKNGAEPVGLNPEFITDEKIMKLFQRAINDNNIETMSNLLVILKIN